MDKEKTDSASSPENNGNDSSDDSSSGACDVSFQNSDQSFLLSLSLCLFIKTCILSVSKLN